MTYPLRRRRALLALAIGALLTIAGIAAQTGTSVAAGAKPKCPVRVAVIAGLTGSGAQNGTTVLAGANVAIKRINATGGVLGCPIKLDTFNDGSDYSKVLPLFSKAASSKKYSMIWSADFGCGPSAPLAARLKILSISGCAFSTFATKSHSTVFDVAPIAARGAMVAAQYGLRKGYKKFAFLVDDTQIGQDDVKAATAIVKAGGGTVTDVERLPVSGINFSSAVQRAKASKPDVVFVDMFGAAAGHLHRDIATSGWKVPIIGGTSNSATSFKGLVPLSVISKTISVAPASLGYPSNPTRKKFIASVKAQGKKIDTFLFGYAHGHDPLTLFAWGANQVKSLDSQKIAAKLRSSGNVKIPGLVQGTTTGYTKNCGQWNAKDAFVIVKGGFYNEGRLRTIATATSPPLPRALDTCR